MKFKTLLTILIAALLILGCGENNSSNENTTSEEKEENPTRPVTNNFFISGSISGAANSKIYVEGISESGAIPIAENSISENGNFKIEGNIPGFGIYQLRLGESQNQIIPLTMVPGDKITINTSFEKFISSPNASGTKWTSIMNDYMAILSSFMIKQKELNAMQGKLSEAEIMNKYNVFRKPLDIFSIEKMKADPSNPFNIILSKSAIPTTGFENWDPKNLEILKLVTEAYLKTYEGSPMAENMMRQTNEIEFAYNEFKTSKDSGIDQNNAIAPEIAMNTPDGKLLKLSSLRGKVVLIDFWASWCKPCRMENPNVVRLYNKYKNKGFTVFSVSLDQDINMWKQAIAADGLIWPNHVSDLQGWQTPMTQLYGFNGIPYTVLIDKNGKILGVGLRGQQLEQKLNEVLL
jgi:thiol-disulfide isomerase/thioredoxin